MTPQGKSLPSVCAFFVKVSHPTQTSALLSCETHNLGPAWALTAFLDNSSTMVQSWYLGRDGKIS